MKHTERFISYYLALAETTAGMSYATRLQVGSVFVKNNAVISTGYNGTAPGESNNCEYVDEQGVTRTDHDRVIHSEDNALRRLRENKIDARGATLCITHAPCDRCAELLIEARIACVYYVHPYRDETGINMLKAAGIPVQRVTAFSRPKPERVNSVVATGEPQ